MTRIVSVTSSRADIGILEPVWNAVLKRTDCELHLFLTGMQRADGERSSEGIPAAAILHEGGSDLSGDPQKAAQAMGDIASDAGALYNRIRPDAILATGDRLDMFPAAMASLPFNIPLVHLHGGEITEGAIDDRIRHALTKLSHLHCASSPSARERLLALGEEDWRIHVTGAPGLDTLRSAPRMTAAAFAAACGLTDIDGLRLVTIHPETNSTDPQAPSAAVLEALAARPAPTLLTAPNSDPGGREMRQRVEVFTERYPWAHFRATLGPRLYANALRHAAVMVGNSSSGIIEAGFFGLPVINVGARQKGRERGSNVIDTANDANGVIAIFDQLGRKPPRWESVTYYGDGYAGPRIAEILAKLPSRERLLRKRIASPAAPSRTDTDLTARPSYHGSFLPLDPSR